MVFAGGLVLARAGTAGALELPPVVFVEEDLAFLDALPDGPSPRPGLGGRLLLREPDGAVRELVANDTNPPTRPLAYADPDVSYDGRTVVFAGYTVAERSWRIYEVDVDGRNFRQLTHSDQRNDLAPFGAARQFLAGYDDMDPCYLPDGRICFVSTRLPAIAPDGRQRATNLYVMDADGSDLHRITTERFGADTPAVDPTSGRIVYSRWWRSTAMRAAPAAAEEEAVPEPEPPPVPPGGYYGAPPPPPPPPPVPDPAPPAMTTITDAEFLGLNSWFLAAIHPDGTGLHMHAGFHIDRELTQAWKPSFRPDGLAYALFLPATPFVGRPGATGLRAFRPGLAPPVAIGGPQTFAGAMADEFVYAGAQPLPGGALLVAAAPAAEPRAFTLYTLENPQALPLRVSFDVDPHGAVLDPVPILARPTPPLIADTTTVRLRDEAVLSVAEAYEKGGSFTFVVENIHFNGPLDAAMPSAPPVGKDLSIEFYMNPQRTTPGHADPPILIRRTTIPLDGRVEVELPAGVPLFEVLRSPDGEIPRGRDGQVYHVGGMNFGQAGQTARCVGCHTGHSRLAVPEDATWTNLAPSAEIEAPFPRHAFEGPYRPENLVDLSTEPAEGEWDARDVDTTTAVQLAWSTVLQAREIVLYGPRLRAALPIVSRMTLRRSLAGDPVDETAIDTPVTPQGLRVALDPRLGFDALALEIPPQSAGAPPVLAEIEVIARAAPGSLRNFRFSRGDADCNGGVQTTDALVLLQGLFHGEGRLCCEAAADADASGALALSDSVYLLNYLFLSGPALPWPQDCGFGSSTLSCAASSCAGP